MVSSNSFSTQMLRSIRDRSFFMSMGGLVGFRGGHEKKNGTKGGGGSYQKKLSERGGGGSPAIIG